MEVEFFLDVELTKSFKLHGNRIGGRMSLVQCLDVSKLLPSVFLSRGLRNRERLCQLVP